MNSFLILSPYLFICLEFWHANCYVVSHTAYLVKETQLLDKYLFSSRRIQNVSYHLFFRNGIINETRSFIYILREMFHGFRHCFSEVSFATGCMAGAFWKRHWQLSNYQMRRRHKHKGLPHILWVKGRRKVNGTKSLQKYFLLFFSNLI